MTKYILDNEKPENPPVHLELKHDEDCTVDIVANGVSVAFFSTNGRMYALHVEYEDQEKTGLSFVDGYLLGVSN